MGFSIAPTSSQRPNTANKRVSPFPALAQVVNLPQIALAWGPHYALPSSQYPAFQNTNQYFPGVPNLPDQHLFHTQQNQSARSQLILSNACPQCQRQPKLPDHRFCSATCGQSAAWSAPELKCLPPHHELFTNVANQFVQHWGSDSEPPPRLLTIYMITWTASSQRSFEKYRDSVEAQGQYKRLGRFPGNEQKRFRSTTRACTLGEGGNLSPCHNEACWMCETIRYGFGPHLQRKRNLPLNASGIRLGAGIYTSLSSSKANQYACNAHDPSSSVKAMLSCRVVIGEPYVTLHEDPTIRRPPPGYNCVSGQPRRALQWSAFKEDELVVYDADAIRPAYLILYDTACSA